MSEGLIRAFVSALAAPQRRLEAHHLSGGTLQRQEKWWLIALTEPVFALTLVHHNLPGQIETDGGPEQRHRGWASDVRAINQKIAAVTGAFEARLGGMPDGRTPQMGTNGNQRIQAIGVTYHPHSLGVLEAGAD